MLRKDLRHDICPDINPANVPNPKPCGASDAASFLGIPDLTNKAVGITLVILIVLYVGSQLLSSVLMSSATVDKNQRMIMLGLPFVFVPFVTGFPAGLLVYWITTNLWTVGQQTLLRRTVKHHPVAVAAGGGGVVAAGPPGDGAAKSGGLFGRLVERAQHAGEQQQARRGDGEKAQPAPSAPATKTAPPPRSPRKKKKRSGRRR
jgi:YidC/Oxa1 family membrane protein insertase